MNELGKKKKRVKTNNVIKSREMNFVFFKKSNEMTQEIHKSRETECWHFIQITFKESG